MNANYKILENVQVSGVGQIIFTCPASSSVIVRMLTITAKDVNAYVRVYFVKNGNTISDSARLLEGYVGVGDLLKIEGVTLGEGDFIAIDSDESVNVHIFGALINS